MRHAKIQTNEREKKHGANQNAHLTMGIAIIFCGGTPTTVRWKLKMGEAAEK